MSAPHCEASSADILALAKRVIYDWQAGEMSVGLYEDAVSLEKKLEDDRLAGPIDRKDIKIAPAIAIDLTSEQLAVFEKIGVQMRATPNDVILAAACGYVDMIRDDQAAEYSGNLFCHVVQKQAPVMPKLWDWITIEDVAHA